VTLTAWITIRFVLSAVFATLGCIAFLAGVRGWGAIKTIVKATFGGALFFGFVGGFVGAVAALIIWPSSNLGPPVGAIYGVLIGVPIGVLSGFILGLKRVRARQHKGGSTDVMNQKAEL
jgi:hypothetical protein